MAFKPSLTSLLTLGLALTHVGMCTQTIASVVWLIDHSFSSDMSDNETSMQRCYFLCMLPTIDREPTFNLLRLREARSSSRVDLHMLILRILIQTQQSVSSYLLMCQESRTRSDLEKQFIGYLLPFPMDLPALRSRKSWKKMSEVGIQPLRRTFFFLQSVYANTN